MLATAFAGPNLERTIDALTGSQPTDPDNLRQAQLEKALTTCDGKLPQYRSALDAGADPSVVTDWMSETQTERRRLEAEIHDIGTSANPPLIREQITELITELGDITSVLRQAEPDAKAKLYRQLDLRLDYDPETQTVSARIDLGTHRRGMVRVRSPTRKTVTR